MRVEKKIGILDANILYLIGAFLFIFLGSYVQMREILSGLLITQIFIILIPPFLYLALKKVNIKRTMRLNKLSIKHGLLIVVITFLMYPVAVTANALGMLILSLFGNLSIPQLPMPTEFMGYVKAMAVISLAAGICEEIFFRGFILTGYEKLGKRNAIIISAILFGIFHLNIYNLLGPIVLGLVFGYFVVLTNSIYAGIIGHIVNNGIAVTLGFIMIKLQEILQDYTEVAGETSVELSTTQTMLVSLLVFGFIAVITSTIAYFFARIIKRDIEGIEASYSPEKPYDFEEELYIEANDLVNNDSKYGLFKYLPVVIVVAVFIFFAYIQITEIVRLG
ncbi:MAG: CPBP family intramembrane metalloprotease domain-containing protein [Alkaliphilus sp.]|nr:CPBP family intramembrane metalloprotease [bacterium AH-315-G05]PHS35782.1 MAG: CPBP family intramembrane metalloprotease domain-containing protein [Alkaliphilus sp.]